MYKNILPAELLFPILEQFDGDAVTEIRIRAGRPVSIGTGSKYYPLTEFGEKITATSAMIASVMSLATENSMYAVTQQLVNGYLNCEGGVRVGVSGEGVRDKNGISAVKNITSICIRVPHQVKGCLDAYKKPVREPGNTLIVSGPGAGKTTLLRELTRLVSDSGKNCLVIDERGELAAARDGRPALDLGDNTDIYTLIPKAVAYQNAIRSMAPEIIVTDEVFGSAEVAAIEDITRAGVTVFATVHASSIDRLKRSGVYKALPPLFRYFFVLSKTPHPGTVTDFFEGAV